MVVILEMKIRFFHKLFGKEINLEEFNLIVNNGMVYERYREPFSHNWIEEECQNIVAIRDDDHLGELINEKE